METKDLATVAPGGVAVAASWLGLVETSLSILLLLASLCFLAWRWRQAVREKK
jgi:membrane protein implicated in regulation of membrane protease activity|tara:strand:+ start:472 stop:630 length:159 start_codon:yes stop_codon:yes gene_type:complete